ncbi:MAG: DUF4439 domain-containing protein [Janthinobacterium lividum]
MPGTETTPTAQRRPDDDARDAVVADARRLLALASSGAAAQPALEATVQACAAHLRALGENAADTSPTGAAGVSPDPAPAPEAVADELATTAGRALALADLTTAGLARLLAAIAASRAVLLDGIVATTAVPITRPSTAPPSSGPTEPSAPTTPSATTPSATASGPAAESTAALQRVLAGEHAAVFAYALVAGRVGALRRPEAYADLDTHRSARDELADRLSSRGVTPRGAAASYDAAAPTSEAAVLLAASVEEGLAAVYADVVAASSADRAWAGDALVRAARAGRRWGSGVRSFPGLPELGEDGHPVPTRTSSPSPTSS